MGKNDKKTPLKAKDIIGKKTLILGEVGSGKTFLASKLLEELMTLCRLEDITVIDMAPQRVGEVGGKLSEYVDLAGKVRYLSPERVYAPRLTGGTRQQVLEYAEMNRKAIEPLLNEFSRRPTQVLILNDVTLYLHAGKLGSVVKCVKLAHTFLATAYHGSRLAEDRGSGISAREQQLVKKLSYHMNQVIRINNSPVYD